MPIRVVPSEPQLPSQFVRKHTDADLRRIRKQDRRMYRRGVVFLVIYQLIVLLPVRYVIDLTLKQPIFKDFSFIQAYVPAGMAVSVLLIWIFGILWIFGGKDE